MEPKFKTSFIPKKTMPSGAPTVPNDRPAKKKGGGILNIIAGIIFVVALAATGGVLVYQNFLVNSIATKSQQLKDARNAFQPALVKEIERYANRVESAEEILANHLAPSALFELFEVITLQNVQYESLAMTAKGRQVTVDVEGIASDLEAIALQSDIFSENRYITDSIVYGVDVDETLRGVFSVTAVIDDIFLLYENRVEEGAIEPVEASLNEVEEDTADNTDQSEGQQSAATNESTAQGGGSAAQQQAEENEPEQENETTSDEPVESDQTVTPPPPGGIPNI